MQNRLTSFLKSHDCGEQQSVDHVEASLHTFLIVSIRRALRSLGKYCFICQRWRAVNVRPKMADLSAFRYPNQSEQYAITNTGMDVFGPFLFDCKIVENQMHCICLFSCLVTRVMHLEMYHDLSLDDFLMVIERFVFFA